MAELSPSKLTHILRGLKHRCPGCGASPLYRRYLEPVANCAGCGEAFEHLRADDFPPCLTILVVGHLVVPLILLAERHGASTALQIVLWLPTTLGLTLVLLPRCKGAVLGLMWSLGSGAGDRR